MLRRMFANRQRWLIPILGIMLCLALLVAVSVWPMVSGAGRGGALSAGTNSTNPSTAPINGETGLGLNLSLTSTWQPILWTVLALALVLGLLYATLWVMRSVTQPTGIAGRSDTIRILSTVHLSREQAIHVIQFNGQTLLIGTSPSGVTLLARQGGENIENQSLPASKPASAQSAAAALAFDRVLSAALRSPENNPGALTSRPSVQAEPVRSHPVDRPKPTTDSRVGAYTATTATRKIDRVIEDNDAVL